MSGDNRSQPKRKIWDFNPKRGLLYFLYALPLLPVAHGAGYLLDADFSWKSLLLSCSAVAAFIGLIGTFTEHVDL